MAQFMNEAAKELPTFQGIKYTSNDLDGAAAALKANDGKYAVFLGADTLIAGAAVMGFDSIIATTLNFAPQLASDIMKAVNESRIDEARKLQNKLSAACDVITKDGAWVPTMKIAMGLITPIDVGKARPPLDNLTEEQQTEMKNSLKALSIF